MADHRATNSGLVLTDGGYDILRFFVEKVFPGLGLFYATVAAIWGWGYEVEVGGSFAALSVLGSVFLTFARKGYTPEKTIVQGPFDGPFVGEVVEDITAEGEPALRLQLDTSATADILNQKYLVFKGLNSTDEDSRI